MLISSVIEPSRGQFARSAEERDAKMLAMTSEEQAQALAWMRESELKHARLAMLGAAGWPLAELNSGAFLKELGTNGRAPSLFNGHLLPNYLPFLLVAFAPIAFLEFRNKDTLPGGDYGFDPLGCACARAVPNIALPYLMCMCTVSLWHHVYCEALSTIPWC
jgi:hypothetical protein